MFHKWSSFKLVQRIEFYVELWLLRYPKEGNASTFKPSSPKLLSPFENHLSQMFLGLPSTKIVQFIQIS